MIYLLIAWWFSMLNNQRVNHQRNVCFGLLNGFLLMYCYICIIFLRGRNVVVTLESGFPSLKPSVNEPMNFDLRRRLLKKHIVKVQKLRGSQWYEIGNDRDTFAGPPAYAKSHTKSNHLIIRAESMTRFSTFPPFCMIYQTSGVQCYIWHYHTCTMFIYIYV